MNARRDFLRQLVPAGVVGMAALKTDWLGQIASATAAAADRSAAEIAADEGYWRDIQQAFTLDRTIGFTIRPEDEVEGIDLLEHAESAYELTSFGGGSARSVIAARTAPLEAAESDVATKEGASA